MKNLSCRPPRTTLTPNRSTQSPSRVAMASRAAGGAPPDPLGPRLLLPPRRLLPKSSRRRSRALARSCDRALLLLPAALRAWLGRVGQKEVGQNLKPSAWFSSRDEARVFRALELLLFLHFFRIVCLPGLCQEGFISFSKEQTNLLRKSGVLGGLLFCLRCMANACMIDGGFSFLFLM